jgi:hypothetical protein
MQHDIFYWPQEDLLRERAAAASWGFSILRPQMILGDAVGSPMSMVAAIGVYAAIMRELNEPLRFPGGGEHTNACSDSLLIAEAAEYVATTPNARGETFNVVNGDVIVWHDLWPAIANHFQMPVADPRPLQLAVEMPKLAAVWERLASRHGLRNPVLAEVAGSSWQFADLAFAYGRETPPNRVMSPIKLRKHGFASCRDTEDAFTFWLSRLQTARILPH